MIDLRIVLVRPHYPGNLGSVARVMHNFGAKNLTLVDPVASIHEPEARRLATHGEFILDQARIVADLPSALHDCVLTAATSAKTEGVVRQTGAGDLRGLAPIIASAGGPVALVFGPEPSGLTSAETNVCHYLLHIPTSPEFPTLNLAQAVAITLYELSMVESRPREGEPPASFEELERMFSRLRSALEAIHFLYGPKADSLMHALRYLIGRAQPTAAEVKLLHGLSRQLEWVLAHGIRTPQDRPDLDSPDNP